MEGFLEFRGFYDKLGGKTPKNHHFWRPMSKIVVLMGVSGCGKSTIGEILARDFDGVYFDGDDFHPPENVEKMRQGIPLTDEDRVGWKDRLCDLIRRRKFARNRTYIACSALRLAFRDGLREACCRPELIDPPSRA